VKGWGNYKKKNHFIVNPLTGKKVDLFIKDFKGNNLGVLGYNKRENKAIVKFDLSTSNVVLKFVDLNSFKYQKNESWQLFEGFEIDAEREKIAYKLDDKIIVANLWTKKELVRLQVEKLGTTLIGFSPDGNRLFYKINNDLLVYDAKANKIINLGSKIIHYSVNSNLCIRNVEGVGLQIIDITTQKEIKRINENVYNDIKNIHLSEAQGAVIVINRSSELFQIPYK